MASTLNEDPLFPFEEAQASAALFLEACCRGDLQDAEHWFGSVDTRTRQSGFQRSVEGGHKDLARTLGRGMSISARRHALCAAVAKDDAAMLRIILRHDPTELLSCPEGHVPFQMAIEHGKIHTLEILAPYATHNSLMRAMERVCAKGDIPVIKVLMALCDEDKLGHELVRAACAGRLEVVCLLLPYANGRCREQARATAVRFGHWEIVEEFNAYAARLQRGVLTEVLDKATIDLQPSGNRRM
ncbi:hypothetical protein [Pseudoxanthomonas mexicana]